MSEKEELVISEEKIKNLVEDEKFIDLMLDMQTPEEVQRAFAEKGIELSLDEVEVMGELINKMIEKGTTNLSKDDLEDISGGVIGEVTAGLKEGVINAATGGLMYSIPDFCDDLRYKMLSRYTSKDIGKVAGNAIGLTAVVGAGYALAKRKKIVRWVRGKFKK